MRLLPLRFIPLPPPSSISLNPLPPISQTLSFTGSHCFCTEISRASVELHWGALSRLLRWPFSGSTGVRLQASPRGNSPSIGLTQSFGLNKKNIGWWIIEKGDVSVCLKLMIECESGAESAFWRQREEETSRFTERWNGRLFGFMFDLWSCPFYYIFLWNGHAFTFLSSSVCWGFL